MASIARQSPMLRQSCLSAFRSSPLANRNAAGVSQMVAFHASAKKQILPPLPRELDLFLGIECLGLDGVVVVVVFLGGIPGYTPWGKVE